MKSIQTATTHKASLDGPTLSHLVRSSCSRCGGLLVTTFCVSPDQGSSEFQISVWKCLQCGDLFDSTILQNRQRSQQQLVHN